MGLSGTTMAPIHRKFRSHSTAVIMNGSAAYVASGTTTMSVRPSTTTETGGPVRCGCTGQLLCREIISPWGKNQNNTTAQEFTSKIPCSTSAESSG